jgi:hypothetical protein
MVSWWPGDADARDIIGANPGTLQNGTAFAAGKIDPAFSFDGVNDFVDIPASSSLDVGNGDGLTLELWIQPSDISDSRAMVEYNDGAGHQGVHFWHSIPPYGGVGALFANIADSDGNIHLIFSSSGFVKTNVFQHVAVTYDKIDGTAKLFYNGVAIVSTNLGIFTPQTSYGLQFGTRISGTASGNNYRGLMDEIGLHNRALEDTEVLAIFNAGSAGKCKAIPPEITVQPGKQRVQAGSNATFSVSAVIGPLGYQWHFNGSDIIGATSSTLSLNSVQTNQAGDYTVTVSNPYGSTPSSNAPLVVVKPQCISAPPGLVSWWPAEGDATEPANGDDGIVQGDITFVPGESGQAFSLNGINSAVRVIASSELNVGAEAGLTIECWIKPSDLATERPVVEWNNGSSYGVHLWVSQSWFANGGPGDLFANIRSSGADHPLFSSAGALSTNVFQHVAVTYDKATGMGVLYINGTSVYSANFGSFTPITSYDLYLGRRASPDRPLFYAGLLDEVGLYKRALTASEIQAIFYAGNAGKTCIPPEVLLQPLSKRVRAGTNVAFTVAARGALPLAYQWRLNGANISGGTNSSLMLTNAQPSIAGNYSVRITNNLAAAISSNASLRVDVIFAFGNGQALTNAQASFVSPVTIQLQNVYPNGAVFYTLDGSTPTITSTQYNDPFVVTHSVILRALGYSPDFFQSGEMDPVNVLIVPTYKLTTTNTVGGAITVSPPIGPYMSNTVVSLTANPSPGWVLLQWLGDITGTTTNVSVTMNRDKYAQAVFGTTLNTTAAGNGSVVLSPPGGVYPYGTIVWLTGMPQPGSYFGLWGNAASGNVNPLSFGVTNPNPTVSSLFSPVGGGQAALTVVSKGNGRISVSPRANVYSVGQGVTITATPDSGQSFSGWSGDSTGTQNPLAVVLDQSKIIYANFTHRSALSAHASYEGLKQEGFVLTLTGDFGGRYQISSSSNLLNWLAVGIVTNPFGTVQFLDTNAMNLTRRFYQGVLLP